MNSVAVYVATTGGPVRVERVTPERAPQSLVCLGRSSNILPISGDYDDFVRPGSGIIEREFGPHENVSYRLDLSGPIGSGRSWQLGFFMAHALSTSGRLALLGDDAVPDEIVVVTGQVDFDLNVVAVDHIPQKISGLIDALPDMADCSIRLIVPAGDNFEQAARNVLPDDIEIISVATAWDACRVVGLGSDDKSVGAQSQAAPILPEQSRAQPTVIRHRPWGIATLSALVVAVVILVAYLVLGLNFNQANLAGETGGQIAADDSDGASTLALGQVEFHLLSRRPPAGRTCADVQFADVPPVLDPVTRATTGGFQESQLKIICGLTFEIEAPDQGRYVALLLQIRSGKRVGSAPPPPSLGGDILLSGVAAWSITLPRHLSEPFAYDLIVLEVERSIGAEVKQIHGDQLDPGALQDLVRQGIKVQTISHVVSN